MKQKRVLVLAGGFPQIELIRQLKDRGYFVILADWNEEPVAKKHCDLYYRVSTLDIEAIKKIAIEERISFVITVCTDQALLTVAKVSEDLGLPCYIDYQTGLRVTNKHYMKDVFAKNNIPTAKYIILNELQPDCLKGFNYPLITKPVDCNSSKGVKKATNYDELSAYFTDAVKMSRTHTAIVEEFIDGPEITVDVYVENGKATVLSTSNSEKIKSDEKFVIFRTLNPAIPNVENKIAVVAQQIADAFNLKNTPMLIQMLTDGRDVYVIEFSARTGGGVKYLLIKDISGFDVISAVIDLTEGKLPHLIKKERSFKYLTNEFIYCYPGIFDHLEGFDELKNKGIIKDYYLFKPKGSVFDSINNSGDRIAGFTIVGDSEEEINEKHNIINNVFRVVSNDGKDLARHDLFADSIYLKNDK